MGLLVWAIIGVVAGFVVCALASRKFHHRVAPAALLVLCVICLGVARWADGQSGADAAATEARFFIFGLALVAAAAGGLGWLIFARQRWAMLTSALAGVAYVAALPLIVPLLACAAAEICL